MGNVGFVYHSNFLKHKTGPMHPERPERLETIISMLEKKNLKEKLKNILPKPADELWVTSVHTSQHLDALRAVGAQADNDLAYIDGDTPMSRDSLDVAFLAVGGVLEGIDAIMNNKVTSVFCAVRPPGHHAEPSRAMGFCLFNNVAIGARYFQKKYGLKKILIVDWDVHHGNGTQEAFYKDPSVLFFSTHQYPFYPGTGAETERGLGAGLGSTINVPMKAGSGDNEYIEVFNSRLIPAAQDFQPDAVMISAGFDAHQNDPLASMRLTEEGYAKLSSIVKGIAEKYAEGRIISCLEGGYHLESLSLSVYRHIQVLLDT